MGRISGRISGEQSEEHLCVCLSPLPDRERPDVVRERVRSVRRVVYGVVHPRDHLALKYQAIIRRPVRTLAAAKHSLDTYVKNPVVGWVVFRGVYRKKSAALWFPHPPCGHLLPLTGEGQERSVCLPPLPDRERPDGVRVRVRSVCRVVDLRDHLALKYQAIVRRPVRTLAAANTLS